MLHYTHSVLLLNLHLALGNARDFSGNFYVAVSNSVDLSPKAAFTSDLKNIL